MDIQDYIKENVPHLLLDDPDTKYKCSKILKSSNFSFLHKLVMKTNKHKILEEYLKIYLQTEKGKKELDLKNSEGWTPLMLACRNSNTDSTLETVKILIENKANLDLQNNNGWTALMMASHYSNTDSTFETVKILIENKANLDLQNNNGWTALMMASRYSKTGSTFETVKILVENGANLDLQNNNGWTALMMASCYTKTDSTFETVKILVENGANLDLQNNKGYTALIIGLINFDLDYINNNLEYYKSQNVNILQFILNNNIPINTYDYLIDMKIIEHIDSDIYKNSKHNINIKLNILESYKILLNECIICAEDKNTIICDYNHSTCFRCLHINNYKCLGCQRKL